MTDPELLVERVLRVVEAIPPGRLVSYGDVAAVVGTGPRQVGRVMATWGAGVPWWRVTTAAGELPDHLLAEARRHWTTEGIGVGPRGARIVAHRWDRDALTRAAAAVLADLNEMAESG